MTRIDLRPVAELELAIVIEARSVDPRLFAESGGRGGDQGPPERWIVLDHRKTLVRRGIERRRLAWAVRQGKLRNVVGRHLAEAWPRDRQHHAEPAIVRLGLRTEERI